MWYFNFGHAAVGTFELDASPASERRCRDVAERCVDVFSTLTPQLAEARGSVAAVQASAAVARVCDRAVTLHVERESAHDAGSLAALAREHGIPLSERTTRAMEGAGVAV